MDEQHEQQRMYRRWARQHRRTRRPWWHFPHVYRYRVAEPGLRACWNRYDTQTIGAAVVAGKYVYCIKWAAAKW